jgi:hypothetical protein
MAYGDDIPTETTWYGHIAEVLAAKGIETIQIAGGSLGQSAGLPDKLILCGDGFKFIEFKSMYGPVRLNQAIRMRTYNLKSVLYSGRLACYVYRQPGTIQLQLGTEEAIDLVHVDALKDPEYFWLCLNDLKMIGQNQRATDWSRALFKACDYSPNLGNYLVTVDHETYTKATLVQAYSADLALVYLTGLTSKELAATGKLFVVQDSDTGEVCIESVRG